MWGCGRSVWHSTCGTALALLLACGAAPAAAQSGASSSTPQVSPPAKPNKILPTPAPSWNKLTAAQQAALAPIAADWDAMDAPRKKKWLAVAQRYPQLSAQDQQRMHQRMQAWSSLTPAQRQAARDNYTQALSSPASAPESGQSQANLNAQWAKYQSLPPEKRAALQAAAEQARKPAAADPKANKPRPIQPTQP